VRGSTSTTRGARQIPSLALALGLCWLQGCTVKTAVVEPSVPGIVDDGLKTLTTEQNQERIKTLLALPDVQKSSRELARGVVAGALSELSAGERQAQLDLLAENFVLAVTQALAQGTDQHIGPAITRQTTGALRANLELLLGDEVKQDSAAYVSAVTHAFSTTLTRSMSEGLRRDVTPALTAAFTDELFPGVARGFEADLRPALLRTSRDVAREASLGLNDALAGELGDTIDRRFLKRVDGWLGEGRDLADEAMGQLKVAIVVLVVLLVGAGAVVFFVVRTLRKRTRALELVTYAIKDFTRSAPDRRLVESIKEQGKKGPGRAALDEFLVERPQLKA